MTPTQEDIALAFDILSVGMMEGANMEKATEFAVRHRLAAEERGARMALEAAAKAFEAEADTWVQTPLRGAMKRKGATAIRQIDPAALKGEG